MKKEVKIGLFTIIVIIGAWGGIRFLSSSDIFSNDKVYYATYDNIGGLQNASPIYIKGVKVGNVSNIELNIEQGANVVVELTVSNKYNIPNDSKVKIFSDGLIGSKAVDMIVGESNDYLSSGDAIPSIPNVDIFEVAGDELQYLKERVDRVTTDLSTTLQNLNTLIEGNAEHLGGAISNLDALSLNLNQLLESNSENMTRAVSGFADLSETIGNNSESIESIINNIESLTQNLNEAQIDNIIKEVNSLLAKINSGEGNIGKIMSDEDLYMSLSSASANLDSLLYDFKKNPKRYVNFSLIGRSETKEIEKAEKRDEKRAKK